MPHHIHYTIKLGADKGLKDLLAELQDQSGASFSWLCGFNRPHLCDPGVLLNYLHTFLFCIMKNFPVRNQRLGLMICFLSPNICNDFFLTSVSTVRVQRRKSSLSANQTVTSYLQQGEKAWFILWKYFIIHSSMRVRCFSVTFSVCRCQCHGEECGSWQRWWEEEDYRNQTEEFGFNRKVLHEVYAILSDCDYLSVLSNHRQEEKNPSALQSNR